MRARVRAELKERAGGAKEAFRKIDLNGSGSISSQEFADGITRLGVHWQQITGLKRPRDLFNLFDEDKDATVVFKELFPDELFPEEPGRPSTPHFCRAYIDNRLHQIKGPCWSPSSPEEELRLVVDASQRSDDAAEKRKWMRSTMRRLKTRGKSDARCREVVALHLPRGTGPKDREGVSTFTQVDLKSCRKTYNDEVNMPMRRMWKVVGDYKDQRREQKRIYDRLYSVTKALQQRQEAEEAITSLSTGLLLGKFKEESRGLGPGVEKGGGGVLSKLARQCDMDDMEVEDLYKDFVKFTDTEEMLGKRGFCRLVQALLPFRRVADAEAEAWWEQAQQGNAAGDTSIVIVPPGKEAERDKVPSGSAAEDGHSGEGHLHRSKTHQFLKSMETRVVGSKHSLLRAQCGFEHFCVWWAESEARHS